MNRADVRAFATIGLFCAAIAACSGGGSSGPSQVTQAPTISPSPSPTPASGPPGPTLAIWKGDGSYVAQSDPNWPLSFIPVPNDPVGTITKGPPIIFTALGQSVTVSLSQANYLGALPTLVIFNGPSCSGISGQSIGNNQSRFFYNSAVSANCSVQMYGETLGSYQGAAVMLPFVVPNTP